MDKPTKAAKRRDHRSFTPEFKAEVLRLCKAGNHSIERLAKNLNLTETALRE
jgi:transposase-like protein